MAEPVRVQGSSGEEAGGFDHEQGLVGIVEAGQAEADLVETQQQRGCQNRSKGRAACR